MHFKNTRAAPVRRLISLQKSHPLFAAQYLRRHAMLQASITLAASKGKVAIPP
jgi:hypothetical protein